MKFAKISLVLALPLLLAAIAAPVPAKDPTKLAADRAAELKKDLANFDLVLKYVGASDKPYYDLTISVKAPPRPAEKNFGLHSQITEDDAKKIIDYLATEGFLDNALDANEPQNHAAKANGYLMSVNNKYVEDIGFNLKMLTRLDNLKPILPEAAQKNMSILIQRLSGHRKQWQQNP